jgi:hypothetical protein
MCERDPAVESRQDIFGTNAVLLLKSFDASLKDVLQQRLGFGGSFKTDKSSLQGQKLAQLWQLAYHLFLAFEKIVAGLPAVFIGTLAF